jgi:hypothetical protein
MCTVETIPLKKEPDAPQEGVFTTVEGYEVEIVFDSNKGWYCLTPAIYETGTFERFLDLTTGALTKDNGKPIGKRLPYRSFLEVRSRLGMPTLSEEEFNSQSEWTNEVYNEQALRYHNPNTALA